MSDAPASYAFLPWLRRGIAREITRLDFTLTGAARAEVPVTLELDAAGDRRDVAADLPQSSTRQISPGDSRQRERMRGRGCGPGSCWRC